MLSYNLVEVEVTLNKHYMDLILNTISCSKYQKYKTIDTVFFSLKAYFFVNAGLMWLSKRVWFFSSPIKSLKASSLFICILADYLYVIYSVSSWKLPWSSAFLSLSGALCLPLTSASAMFLEPFFHLFVYNLIFHLFRQLFPSQSPVSV